MTPMQLGTAAELEILRDSLIAGVLMGIAYDPFRVIRHKLSLPVVRFACDFLYALLFGAAFFVFSLDETDYFRGFILFGMLAGAAMWSFTAGRAVTALAEGILALFGKIPAFILNPFIVILHKSANAISPAFVKIQPKSEMIKKIPKST